MPDEELEQAPDPARLVLVFRPGQLGDTIVALPALAAIRARHPRARLVLLTDVHPKRALVSAWEVLAPTGLFSDVVFYDPAGVARGWPALAARLRKFKADVLYYLAPAPRSPRQAARDRFFFRRVCGIPDLRGLAPADAPLNPERRRLLRLIGERDGSWTWTPGERERTALARLWTAAGFAPRARPIFLAPGSAMASKRWPIERYGEVAAALGLAAHGFPLIIVGGAQETPLAWEIQRTAPVALDWTGRLGVATSAAAFARAALFLGNDSGAMHLAASAGAPCVAIFSGRDRPGVWEPEGDAHVVLRRAAPCSPCYLADCRERGLECLTQISVQDVFSACLNILARQHDEALG